ncbi:MAG: hypothetical protein GXP29_05440 [Planctomycetes bacterium]|nr:hypothetical protein [Planctomycetota bacterium]
MNKREKTLLIVFASVAGVGLAYSFVNPVFIQPLIKSDEQIRVAMFELEEIHTEHEDLELDLKKKYDTYVLRNKTVEPDEVRDDLYDCISSLVQKSRLKKPRISPREPKIDKRTKIVTIGISMSATGTFRDCVSFVRAFYRIPYVARFNSLKFTPTSARQKKGHDEVKLEGEIEVMVLPEDDLFDLPKGKQPKEKNKYDDDMSLTKLKRWKPFTPYYKRDVKKRTPPPGPSPTPTPTPRPIGEPSWPDGSQWVLRMVMRYGVDEVRLVNESNKSTLHIAVGEEFDGGTLLLVEALGVVAFKEGHGYRVYPLGSRVSEAIALEDAVDWPEIQGAMVRYFAEEDRRAAAEAAKKKELEETAMLMELMGPPAGSNGLEMARDPSEASGLGQKIASDASSTGVEQASSENVQPQPTNGVEPVENRSSSKSKNTAATGRRSNMKPDDKKSKASTKSANVKEVPAKGNSGNKRSGSTESEKDSIPK